MSWTDERVHLLRSLHAKHLSASQIAARLGGVTRNGVIGKLHRLGLSGNSQFSNENRRQTARLVNRGNSKIRPGLNFARANGFPRSPRANAGKAPDPAHPSAAGASLHPSEATDIAILESDPAYEDCVTLEQLKPWQCRFPIGYPAKFCGKATCERGSGAYCSHHAARCLVGLPKREAKPRPFSLNRLPGAAI